jgi:ATP/maltotriose-dependent transcriptional regulator MalT
VTADEQLEAARAALEKGRWAEARAGFEEVLAERETPEARFGWASASWWLGENQACVDACTRAYALFRRSGDVASAAQCAVWLAITYKSNFANYVAANGWLARAERLLGPVDLGPAHGWLWIARAYREPDLDAAETLSRQALEVGRAHGDVDLELTALSQLGLIRVGRGETAAGFTLIDEAMAAALAGERTALDTVVYTCCDMLNACELASDIERAAHWCKVADEFVATYGCPFLYAECRIYYGSVLAARGRWAEAEQELDAGLRITDGSCPGLHGRALIRLAGLRIRQGRLEDAELLLQRAEDEAHAEGEQALAVASLLLARGDGRAAARHLEQRLRGVEQHGSHLAAALDVLVDARLATGDVDDAEAAAQRLATLASTSTSATQVALATAAAGRVAAARGRLQAAAGHLELALEQWSELAHPFEAARIRAELAALLVDDQPDLAVEQARRALRAFEALGAAADADRIAAFLRAQGVTARTGAKGVGLLTGREQDVLALLAAGLSNPEIADRLHVSRKTASHHVSSILAKLGVRNRAEAAAHAARLAK